MPFRMLMNAPDLDPPFSEVLGRPGCAVCTGTNWFAVCCGLLGLCGLAGFFLYSDPFQPPSATSILFFNVMLFYYQASPYVVP